jgi:hypothetical protein
MKSPPLTTTCGLFANLMHLLHPPLLIPRLTHEGPGVQEPVEGGGGWVVKRVSRGVGVAGEKHRVGREHHRRREPSIPRQHRSGRTRQHHVIPIHPAHQLDKRAKRRAKGCEKLTLSGTGLALGEREGLLIILFTWSGGSDRRKSLSSATLDAPLAHSPAPVPSTCGPTRPAAPQPRTPHVVLSLRHWMHSLSMPHQVVCSASLAAVDYTPTPTSICTPWCSADRSRRRRPQWFGSATTTTPSRQQHTALPPPRHS